MARCETCGLEVAVCALDQQLPNPLTGRETQLFELLYSHLGRFVPRDRAMDHLYADAIEPPFDKRIRQLVSNLRRKLAGSEWMIETIWSRGWRLVGAGAPMGRGRLSSRTSGGHHERDRIDGGT